MSRKQKINYKDYKQNLKRINFKHIKIPSRSNCISGIFHNSSNNRIFTQKDTSLRIVRSIQFICDMMNAVILFFTIGSIKSLIIIITTVLELVLPIIINAKVTKFYVIKIIGTILEIILLIVIMTPFVNIDGSGNKIVAIVFFLAVIFCYLLSIILTPKEQEQIAQVNPITMKQKSLIPIQILSSSNSMLQAN